MENKALPSNLPDLQRQELELIVQKLVATGLADAIFLYGSFARGDFRLHSRRYPDYPPDQVVPPRSTKLKSDFDILVITETPEAAAALEARGAEFWELVTTPLEIKYLDFKQVNTLHLNRNDFIRTVFKERVVLHDNGKFTLEKRRKLSPERRKELAQEEMNKCLQAAREAYRASTLMRNEAMFGWSAFLLHQTIENLLQMVQLVFICELPHTHNLEFLRGKAIQLAPEIAEFFPQDTYFQVNDLKYLSDAYVGGRYLEEWVFPIRADQLERWDAQAQLLFRLAEKVCRERIEKGW